MLTLTTLNVDAYSVDNLVLTWEYAATTESLTDYEIDIYRSEAPISGDTIEGYTHIASGISAETVSYVDTTVSGYYHYNRDWYYKLVFTNVDTDESAITPDTPAYLNKAGTVDRIYLEILRRKNLVLAKKVGRTYYLLKRHTRGTHCPDCWDDVMMRVTQSECSTCKGTGWVSGYFNPIEFIGETNTAPKFAEITMFGDFMPSDAVLFVTNFPQFKVKDVVVDDNNKRWMVQDIRTVEKLGKILEQRVHIALIMEDDQIYEINIY